ncbi:hypothetical protein HHK36_033406 [Tetracentron sinense]|uniref:Uncharacterized protein n=1 Tax=Tetracentron sinense TaxID=13715 RepID=A0A835CWU3_TETSI|nr:hypothetical protein HHK36_033406 [Tetracentron sinense]
MILQIRLLKQQLSDLAFVGGNKRVLILILRNETAALTLTKERSTPSLNCREPLYDTKSSPAININPAFSRQRTRTHPDYEESLKPEFDYDTSFQELLALKGAYPGYEQKDDWFAYNRSGSPKGVEKLSEKYVEDQMP